MSLDLFTFTYYYGNGDYYTGQGYAEAGTYGASQVLTGYTNETGSEGSYVIDSVQDSGYDSGSGYNNYVYVTGYTDGDTGYGSAYYWTYGSGYSGLGSESGYAYNDYGYGDSFNNSNEADLLSQYYTFTYYYGNGDSYSGYGYAAAGTYAAGQVLSGYANETGYEGYYTIDSLGDTNKYLYSNNYVYVTGYTDGDTGYGSAYYWTYGSGYSGLGSESGYAYNDYGYGDSFNNSNEADLLSQYYTFTYYYGNGDSYSGYGYAAAGTYAAGQVLSGYANETGYEGYYTIDSLGDTNKYLYSNNYVYVTGYYDGDTGYGSAYYISSGTGYSGLGSEYGYAYNSSWYNDSFSNSNEADLLFQQYNYTYYYGNGDSYSGYVYAAVGTYAAGQVLSSYTNETGYEGYYTIDSLGGTTNQLYGYVAVSSYYDGDTGYGSVYYVGGSGYYGLGSESGYVYSNNYSSYDTFSNSNEADLINQYYTFTYTYGNGDSYSGYGYADQGTYVAGQVLSDYYNETGNYGYYTIDSASDGNYSGNNHYVYVNSYTDGDTGYGSAYYVSGNGYSGLGSESGSAYNYSWVADSFSNSNEADLFSQQYNFTYYYGNGDSYSGYGYADQGTYVADQVVLSGYSNETGNYGYYTIDSVDNATTGNRNYVYVTSYTDADTGYGLASYAYGNGYYGLGSEYGYAYNANYSSSDAYFSQYSEADILNQKYTFTYTYGNGDSYSGYGYALQGTYTAGQVLEGYSNETDNYGYYTIDSVDNATTGNNNYVYVTSYTDGDTGFDTTTSIGSPYWWYYGVNGYSGLGSEYGWAYNANNSGDNYFSNYYEADLPGVVQVRLNLLADDGGTPGELIANNQIGVNKSFFVEILVADLRGNAVGVNGLGLDFSWDGFILESINFDPTLAITPNFVLLPDGSLDYDGFISNLSGGSLPEFELGQAIGVNQLERFALLHFYTEISSNGTSYFTTTVSSAALADDASYSLDVETYQPLEVLAAYNQYNFTYSYGNGDSYTGYIYAAEGTYFAGQELSGYYNETGNYGSYMIGSVESTTFDSWYNNRVYVTSYTDGDTGYGTTTNLYNYGGGSGFGSEYGYVYDSNWSSSDSYFDQYNEADILGNQLFNYTYHYGNGDSYSGYGYAAVGTYTAGQELSGYWNETGNYGYYIIDSVELGNTSTGYNGYIYVTSYYDVDTGYGTAGYVSSGTGYSGLTSEYGYAYDSNGYSSDSYFSYYSEADILNQYYTYTYTYGNGDSYSGYGYALAGTYAEGQTIDYGYNETGSYGFYTINSVSAGTADSWYNNQVYVTSYYDGDTGYGYADILNSGTGYSGLTSEYGYVYDSNGSSSEPYFDRYYEADILGNQLFNYTYHYGNGDSYSGYGYAAVGTYTAGQTIGYYPNETTGSYPGGTGAVENDTLGYSFFGDSVYRLSYTFANLSDALTLNFIGSNLQDISDESWGLDNVKVTAGAFNYFNDFESDSVTGWSSSNRSTTPVGSRNFLGEFGNDTVSLALNDAALNGSVTVEFDLFILKSWDGIGNLGAGHDYFALTTSNGHTLLNTTFAKYPGQLQSYPDNGGYYTIDSVELGNTSTGYNGQVYVTSYTDGDTSYAYGTTTNLSSYTGYYGLGSEYGYAYTAEGTSYDSYFSNYYEADLVVPGISITDNSGSTSDASIKFTTELSKFRKNYSDSDFVRPNYADSSKYFDITNTGTGVLSVSGIQINVTGVTTDLDFTGGDLLINPNESQRVKLTYDAAAAKESFNLSNGLVLFTNAVDIPEFAIALSGKSTFNSDINYDGKVNTGDLGSLNQAKLKYDPTADIDGNGIINNLDVSVLLSENKQSVFV